MNIFPWSFWCFYFSVTFSKQFAERYLKQIEGLILDPFFNNARLCCFTFGTFILKCHATFYSTKLSEGPELTANFCKYLNKTENFKSREHPRGSASLGKQLGFADPREWSCDLEISKEFQTRSPSNKFHKFEKLKYKRRSSSLDGSKFLFVVRKHTKIIWLKIIFVMFRWRLKSSFVDMVSFCFAKIFRKVNLSGRFDFISKTSKIPSNQLLYKRASLWVDLTKKILLGSEKIFRQIMPKNYGNYVRKFIFAHFWQKIHESSVFTTAHYTVQSVEITEILSHAFLAKISWK